MKGSDLLVEFYEPTDDKMGTGTLDYDDTRRPRLTIRHLKKLRHAKDSERVDKAEYLNFLPSMYGPKEEEAGGL